MIPQPVLDALLPILRASEGCRLTAYQDSVGVWTIGWGHTGPEVVPGLVWTQPQADGTLSQDLQSRYAAVLEACAGDIVLSPNRLAALLDFVYNVGLHAFLQSSLYHDLQAGNYADVPTQLMKWVKAGGVTLAGLVRRREAECELWNQG